MEKSSKNEILKINKGKPLPRSYEPGMIEVLFKEKAKEKQPTAQNLNNFFTIHSPRQKPDRSGYLAVSSDGELYPCHRFVGKDEYLMGSVFDGIKRRDVQLLFNSAHVNSKKACLRCWARYICGGGCHAYAIEFNGDVMKPYSVECELMKYRIELGAYMYTEIADKCKEFLRQFGEEASQLRPHLSPQIDRESKAGSSDVPTGRRRL